MRRALLGGVAAFLLGTSLASSTPIAHSPTACKETFDLERLQCVPEQSKPLEMRVWVDPDMLLPQEALDAGIRLATEMMYEQGIPLHTQIVKESHTTQYGPGVSLPERVVGVEILREHSYTQGLKGYGVYNEQDEVRTPSAGYAIVPERVALALVRSIDVEDSERCPSTLPLRIATLFLHEIGHLEGLIHPDLIATNGVTCSGIDLYVEPDILWNVMNHDILGLTTGRRVSACNTAPKDLTTKDLGIWFDPIQGTQMRDAIEGGAVWQTLKDSNFSYTTYVDEYQHRIRAREYLAKAYGRPETCTSGEEEQPASAAK